MGMQAPVQSVTASALLTSTRTLAISTPTSVATTPQPRSQHRGRSGKTAAATWRPKKPNP